MRCGFVLPGGTAVEQLDQAVLAEQSGWDGVFVCEVAFGVDPWTLLAAIARQTSRIRLGTMLTPLPWRRPWKLASQVVTLDQLSAGRAVLTVGLGAVDAALGTTGEVTDRRTRAELLDEGIDVLAALMAGNLTYQGKHYTVDLTARAGDLATQGRPVQPRVPIWVVGGWPREKSMLRSLRCDGVVPMCFDDEGKYRATRPDDVRAVRDWVGERRDGGVAGFDVIQEGETQPGAAADAEVRRWTDAGATWWLESRWLAPAQTAARLAAGPPRP
jgi:alkanesulfonate monooxygenase SsuD/methylene tetrahydromethanopterin reductase-like flavin-dependent oxidoreductase (luciferase family)